MHSDQPRNCLLVTQILKVGLVVREWEHREELVTSSTIEKALRRLMTSKEGNDIRKNAVELGNAIRRSMNDGGLLAWSSILSLLVLPDRFISQNEAYNVLS